MFEYNQTCTFPLNVFFSLPSNEGILYNLEEGYLFMVSKKWNLIHGIMAFKECNSNVNGLCSDIIELSTSDNDELTGRDWPLYGQLFQLNSSTWWNYTICKALCLSFDFFFFKLSFKERISFRIFFTYLFIY